MKVEIEIPDWCEDGWLYVMRGMELVAYKYPGEEWKVKTGRCNRCGKCCMGLGEITQWPFVNKEGECEYLKKVGNEFICGLGSNRPWSCSVGLRSNIDKCTETFE